MLSYQPSPFFVLDEVDASLDNTNVAKIANYIRSYTSETFQFIVISLKGSLYERSNSLVGIYRDQDVNSSRTLTLDVSFSCAPVPLYFLTGDAGIVDSVRRLMSLSGIWCSIFRLSSRFRTFHRLSRYDVALQPY